MNLFEPSESPPQKEAQSFSPLADRLRPKTLEEFVGQSQILGPGKPLRRAIERGELYSLILWGPPGSGKTTLARLIARYAHAHFVEFSAVTAGVADIRRVTKEATYELRVHNQRTILFVDEIHRFNKAQQDAFLPFVESGQIVLVGATTENPSFEVIAPLLSRSKVYVLNPLKREELILITQRALDRSEGLKDYSPKVSEELLNYLAQIADGDARKALNALELSVLSTPPDEKGQRVIEHSTVEAVVQRKFLLYDKDGEAHYNLISALHKSLRGSDPDAALYWLARMLEAGEDPLYIARRLVRFASEDIGNADPQALMVANAAKEAVHFVGQPEGDLALAQACVYLALAPKSNAVYKAYEAARSDALNTIAEPVPFHLRNPVTKLMAKLGYGKGYKYPHNYPDAKVDQGYLPENLKGRRYYYPTDRGLEQEFKKRLLSDKEESCKD